MAFITSHLCVSSTAVIAASAQERPVFETGIGLHYGSVIGGVLESGYHDEFTVIGALLGNNWSTTSPFSRAALSP
jgi:hypothetical protein